MRSSTTRRPRLFSRRLRLREDIAEYLDRARLDTVPKIIEIDSMNLDADGGPSFSTADLPSIAYLQYSSGSTRLPTGVMISHRNLQVNFEQLMRSYFAETHIKSTTDATFVSWLPFYHDMGLVLGVCAPILSGYRAELTSPIAFLERPARWIRALAENSHAFSAAPNFAFDLAARKTTDSDLAGLDLGGVLGIINGAERVEPATLATLRRSVCSLQFSGPHAASFIRPGGGNRLRGIRHLE